MSVLIPDPEFYSSWQEWAKELISALNQPNLVNQPPQVPTFLASKVPSAAQRGLLIEVANATGISKLAISTSTAWRNVGDGSIIA